jgi:helix-turn-helix protein
VSPAALSALADAADALARLARAAADEGVTAPPRALVPVTDASKLAKTSVRVVRDAIRAGDLAAYGGQRDRCVRRGDLDAWIESRRTRPVIGIDDRDIDRRVARLSRVRRAG